MFIIWKNPYKTWPATWLNQQIGMLYPGKSQISLGSHSVWSESLLFTELAAKHLSHFQADS